MDFDEIDDTLDPEVGEGHHAVDRALKPMQKFSYRGECGQAGTSVARSTFFDRAGMFGKCD
jgi:hypothetical protein